MQKTLAALVTGLATITATATATSAAAATHDDKDRQAGGDASLPCRRHLRRRRLG